MLSSSRNIEDSVVLYSSFKMVLTLRTFKLNIIKTYSSHYNCSLLKSSTSCQLQCKPLLAFVSSALEVIRDCRIVLYTDTGGRETDGKKHVFNEFTLTIQPLCNSELSWYWKSPKTVQAKHAQDDTINLVFNLLKASKEAKPLKWKG